MTSEALEAAAEKLAEQRTSQPWRLMDNRNREYWRAGAAEIIRAFADNVTDEMAAVFFVPTKFSAGEMVAVPASGLQLRAAILKGIEE